MIEARRYTESDNESWNRFVEMSRQGTFLFNRNYMDYHRDRFTDHSLMFYNGRRLAAVLPANTDGDTLWSHQGLTYGGLLTDGKTTAAEVIDIFSQMNAYLKQEGVRKVIYKPMPWIYQRQPSEEDLYALVNACHARLIVRNISSAINMDNPVKWRYGRKYDAHKAASANVVIEQDDSALPEFWTVLDDNLMENHHAKPVHSLYEMRKLQTTFAENIKLYVARHEGKVVAGSLIYITPQVVHTQYISASNEGKQLHALDLLFSKVLNDFKSRPYFDFGTSNEDYGRTLNHNLIFQKEGFGGRGVCYDWYEYNI